MLNNKIKTNSLKEFNCAVREISKCFKVGDIILLNGDLGSGKTTFVKESAKFLGVEDIVTSPTFTFMKEYTVNNKNLIIYHYDLYRVEDECDIYELGLNESFSKNSISFIEWNKLTRFPVKPIKINIEKTNYDNERIIEVIKE